MFRALVVAWRVSGWRDRLKFMAVALLVPAFAGIVGGGLVERLRPPKTVTVTEYKDRVQTVEHTVTVEKPVVKWRTRTIKVVEYRDNGTIASTTETDESAGLQTGGKTTTTDEHQTETKSGETKTITSPEGRWAVNVLAGADTGGSIVAGVGASYRLVGPLTIGAWGLGPVAGAPGRLSLGVSAGLRF